MRMFCWREQESRNCEALREPQNGVGVASEEAAESGPRIAQTGSMIDCWLASWIRIGSVLWLGRASKRRGR